MILTLTIKELADINRATFDAFIKSGQYALTKNQAYRQFGREQIDLLIANGMLKDESGLMGKKRYIISDIIAAQKAFIKL